MNVMQKLIKRIIVMVVLSCTSVSGAGTSHNIKNFTGLWEGVDINDGSRRTISIADHDEDGVFEIRVRDSFWSLCNGDVGVEQSFGSIEEPNLLRAHGVVTCFQEGIEIIVEHTFEYSKKDDTLVETTVGTIFLPNTLHRVSQSQTSRC